MEEKTIKRCCKCGRELPIDHFYKCIKNKDGLQSHCRECHAVYSRIAYEKRKALIATKKVAIPMHKVYAHAELAKFTPRQLMEELKARGFRWEYILEPQRKIMFEKI
jgi:hypothetical protein